MRNSLLAYPVYSNPHPIIVVIAPAVIEYLALPLFY